MNEYVAMAKPKGRALTRGLLMMFSVCSISIAQATSHSGSSSTIRRSRETNPVASRSYHLHCESPSDIGLNYDPGPEERRNGPRPPMVVIDADISLTPDDYCPNRGVRPSPGQELFRVTSTLHLKVRKFNSDDYMDLPTRPNTQSPYGDCELRPAPGSANEGSLDIGEIRFLGDGIDPSRPTITWDSVSLYLKYKLDAQGGWSLGKFTRHVYLTSTRPQDDHFPGTQQIPLNSCRVDREAVRPGSIAENPAERREREEMRELVHRVTSDRFGDQADRVRLVERAGSRALPYFIQALRDTPYWSDRFALAEAIGAIVRKDPSVLTGLLSQLGGMLAADNADWRLGAAATAAQLGESAAPLIPALTAALRRSANSSLNPEREDILAQRTVVEALGSIGRGAASAGPVLVEKLGAVNDIPYFIPTIARALLKMGDVAVPALEAGLTHSANSTTRLRSAYILGDMGNPGVPALVNAARNGNADTRAAAVAGLGRYTPESIDERFGGHGVSAYHALIGAIADSSANVRRAAARSLRGNVLYLDQVAIDHLNNALRDSDQQVRREAAISLGLAGTRGRKAIPLLIGLLNEQDPGVRVAALQTLESIGPYPVRHTGGETYVHDSDWRHLRRLFPTLTRQQAVQEMSNQNQSVTQALIRLISSENNEVSQSAIGAMERFGGARRYDAEQSQFDGRGRFRTNDDEWPR